MIGRGGREKYRGRAKRGGDDVHFTLYTKQGKRDCNERWNKKRGAADGERGKQLNSLCKDYFQKV